MFSMKPNADRKNLKYVNTNAKTEFKLTGYSKKPRLILFEYRKIMRTIIIELKRAQYTEHKDK